MRTTHAQKIIVIACADKPIVGAVEFVYDIHFQLPACFCGNLVFKKCHVSVRTFSVPLYVFLLIFILKHFRLVIEPVPQVRAFLHRRTCIP